MRQPALYPFYFALFVLLSLYASNMGDAHASEVVWTGAIVLLFTLVIYAVLALVMRGIDRAALVTAVFMFCFLSHRFWIAAWWKISPPLNQRQEKFDHRIVLSIEALLVIWAAYAAMRRIKHPKIWTSNLNRIGMILLICPLALIVIGWKNAQATVSSPGPGSLISSAATQTAAVDRPDIYLIILDAHGRQDVLKSLYHYDDGPFLQHLRDKGFFVADSSTSNYCYTQLSITSTLNLRYLDELAGLHSDDWQPIWPLLRHSALVKTLKQRGYKWVAFESVREDLRFTQADDYEAPPGQREITPFQELMVDTSALSQLGGNQLVDHFSGGYRSPYDFQRRLVLYCLDRAPEVARQPGPKFVFLHLLVPHPPFVFAADGSDTANRGYGPIMDPGLFGSFTADQYRQWYREQAIYIDHRISGMIDQILANSPRPPVIVLISDHGPRSRVNWDSTNPADSDLHECMSNLTAVLMPPDVGNTGLYPGITPVNIFRVVLDNCFGAGLPLLPDRSYFSAPTRYSFIDVTSIVRHH
jgi:hypothetical protein